MQAIMRFRHPEDGHLWMIAAGLSLVLNLCLLTFAGLAAIELKKSAKPAEDSRPSDEPAVATIELVPAEAPDTTRMAESSARRFARTSPDQAAPPPENPGFIGERDTRAASDRPADAAAPPMPSQAGIRPRHAGDIETTESDYRDGALTAEAPEPTAAQAAPPTPVQPIQAPTATGAASPPPRPALLDGPHPVDVPVPEQAAVEESIKTTPQARPATPSPDVRQTLKPAATASKDPAFRGHQRKTAIIGSISRTGRSALDVEDSPLGRYQAAISRAVELEWQRNCVRHRDFITPGYLTVRFFVETSGKVRTVQFVGDMETGEIQKGFTLNSIRNATIPAMPATLRREFTEEPLELVFRFYF